MEKVKFSDLKSALKKCDQSYTLNIGKYSIEIKEELSIQNTLESYYEFQDLILHKQKLKI